MHSKPVLRSVTGAQDASVRPLKKVFKNRKVKAVENNRISIQALREQATRSGASATLTIRSTRLLALVEAVEAAARVEWGPGRTQESWDELAAALARFDFGDDK